jgi:hypothetical protein
VNEEEISGIVHEALHDVRIEEKAEEAKLAKLMTKCDLAAIMLALTGMIIMALLHVDGICEAFALTPNAVSTSVRLAGKLTTPRPSGRGFPGSRPRVPVSQPTAPGGSRNVLHQLRRHHRGCPRLPLDQRQECSSQR